MKILHIASRAIFLAVGCSLTLSAQTPPSSTTPTPLQQTDEGITPPSQDITTENTLASSQPRPVASPWYDNLFSKKLPLDFGFQVRGIHSDNIFFQPVKTEDYFMELSPTLIFTLGEPIRLAPQLDQETIYDDTNAGHSTFVQMTYRPTLRLFDKDSFLDDVDEYANGIISHQFARLTLSLSQTYEKLSSPTIQINTPGTNVNRDIYTTVAKANYIYSDQLSTYGTFTQTVNHYIGTVYNDSTEWVGDYYFLYQLSDKLTLGAGPRVGWVDADHGPNQTYQDALLHLAYGVTSKFAVSGEAGMEVRQYEHDASPERVYPVVEGKAVYQPFDSMTVTLDGLRHQIVYNGASGNEDYTASVATLSLKQRFFQVVFATLRAQYEDDTYTGVGAGFTSKREDEIIYLGGGLEWKSFRGLTIDADYNYVKDDSNIEAFSFNENRITLSASYKY